MTRSQRLLPLIRLAKDGEHQAARGMADARRYLDEQTRRLADLKTYRRDYAARLTDAGRSGVRAGDLHRYMSFLGRLDEVIELQARQVHRATRDYEDKRDLWSAARSRHQSLDKAADHYRQAEDRAEERREQQQNEDRYQAADAAQLLPDDTDPGR